MIFTPQVIFIFIIFFIFNFLLFINFDFLAKKIKFFDKPDNRLKLHKGKTSLLGGTIIMLNFIIFLLINYLLNNEILTFNNKELFFFSLIVLLYYLIGIYDDIKRIRANFKLLLIIISIFFIIYLYPDLSLKIIKISFIEKNYFFNEYSLIFTILSFTLLVNALNMFDGIDLQLISYSIFIFLVFLFNDVISIFSLIMLICLIFLFFLNFKKKLFLGDSGAFLLSGVIGFIFVNKYNSDPFFFYSDEIFILLMVPGIDMLRLFMTRIYNGKNPFKGDLNHLHHLLKNKFKNLLKTNLILSLYYLIPFVMLIAGIKSYVILTTFCIIYFISVKYLLKIAK